MKKKIYMSLTTGQVVKGRMEVIKEFLFDLFKAHFINAKWMEEEKAIRFLEEGRL